MSLLRPAKLFFSGQSSLGVHLSLITTVQIVVSFAIQVYTVTCFGAGRETDALYTGLTLPLVITVLVIETFSVVIIPQLTALPEHDLKNIGWQLFLSAGIFFLFTSLLLFLVAPLLVPLLVPGFNDTAQQLTIRMTRIQVWTLVGTGCYAVLSALYQVRDRFIWALLSQMVATVIGGLLLVWKVKEFGIIFAAWIQVLIAFLPAILLLRVLGGFPRLAWRFDFFKRIWQHMRPMLFGKAYFMLNVPIDRILASQLPPGTIVIFELVGRFYSAILRILNKGIVMPTLPSLSRLAQEGKWERFKALHRRKVWQMAVIGAFAIVMMITAVSLGRMAAAVMDIPLALGKINSESLGMMWMVMILMVGILPSACIGNAQSNAFYAKGDTVTPMRIGVIFCTIGFGAKVLGFSLAGIKGIALVGTVGAVAQAIVMELSLTKRLAKGNQNDQLVIPFNGLKTRAP
jgi:putative peptidoglycan lipid II flippase